MQLLTPPSASWRVVAQPVLPPFEIASWNGCWWSQVLPWSSLTTAATPNGR